MGFVLLVAGLALLAGRLCGGRLGRLATMPLRGPWLVPAAAAVQLGAALAIGLGGLPPRPVYRAALVLAAGPAAVFLLRNRRLPGVGLLAAGLLLNAVVVLANGAMPVSAYAAARAGVPAAAVEAIRVGADPRHESAGARTRLRLLGDVVPVPTPLRREVLSPGDCVAAAGLALLIVTGMRRRRVRPAVRRWTSTTAPSTASRR